MVLILIAVDLVHEKGVSIRGWIASQGDVFEVLVFVAAVTAIIVLGVYGPGYDAASFIYQRF